MYYSLFIFHYSLFTGKIKTFLYMVEIFVVYDKMIEIKFQ